MKSHLVKNYVGAGFWVAGVVINGIVAPWLVIMVGDDSDDEVFVVNCFIVSDIKN